MTTDERIVPQAIFTTPEVAKVGLTHREVEASGVRCHVATHDMRGASNGRATGEDDGYLKLVFDAIDERLLGVQMVNYAGAELIQMAAMAIRSGMTADALAAQLLRSIRVRRNASSRSPPTTTTRSVRCRSAREAVSSSARSSSPPVMTRRA